MLRRLFILTPEGEKNIIKGIGLTTLHQLSLLLPVPLFIMALDEMLKRYNGTSEGPIPLWTYLSLCVGLILIIYRIYLATYTQTYIYSGNESAKTRLKLAEKFRKLPLSYLADNDLSDLTSTLMDDVTTVEKAIMTDINPLFAGVFSSLIVLGVLAVYDWRMTLSLSSCLAVSLFVAAMSKFATNGTNRKNRTLKLNISEGLQEFLENIKVLQSSPKKEGYEANLVKTIKRVVPWAVLYEFLVGIFLSISYNVLRLGLGLVILNGSQGIANHQLSILDFLLFVFVAVRIFDPLTTSSFKIGEVIFSFVSTKRIKNILDYPEQTGSRNLKIERFDIEFDHVSFAYHDENVINDVSFVAKQGEITALIGPSGCGKSTLCKLACRFWDVEQGKVLVGGRDIRKIDPECLLRHFSMVFQKVVLFNDTIFNNIRIGKKDAPKEEIVEAARLARCHDFIMKMPEGYDTVIGENGKTLSGGERQRLSIARAILKQAPIILLDEATASLDPENETMIQEALSTLIKDKTVLIIAHRLRTIENCDKIVVLNEGAIEEVGAHRELINNNGLYKRLLDLQNRSRRWNINNKDIK
jgi:ATP-binding cassette subfamily B protein IrtB